MSLDKKMIEHGLLVHDLIDAFKTEDNCRPNSSDLIKQYNYYWPWDAEDIIVTIIRAKRIEYLMSNEEKMIFRSPNQKFLLWLYDIKEIIEEIEERIGLT